MKARLPQGYGGAGNVGNMLKQAQKMQEDMQTLQAALEEKEYEAQAGGGMVTVKVNGKHEVLSVSIRPEIVDPDDVETLEDILTAACNEAMHMADADSQAEMAKLTGGLGGLGGMNIPGLF